MWISVPNPDDITAEPIFEVDSADAVHYLTPGYYIAETLDHDPVTLRVELTSWLV